MDSVKQHTCMHARGRPATRPPAAMQAAARRHRTTPKPHAAHRNTLHSRPDGRRHPAASTASDNYLKLQSDVCVDSREGRQRRVRLISHMPALAATVM